MWYNTQSNPNQRRHEHADARSCALTLGSRWRRESLPQNCERFLSAAAPHAFFLALAAPSVLSASRMLAQSGKDTARFSSVSVMVVSCVQFVFPVCSKLHLVSSGKTNSPTSATPLKVLFHDTKKTLAFFVITGVNLPRYGFPWLGAIEFVLIHC